MPHYPAKITEQFDRAIGAMRRDLRQVITRVAAIDSGWPLAALPGVIPGTYVAGGPPPANPTVFINGSATATGPYQYLSSYSPAPGDSVLLVPLGVQQTYVVIGKVQ